MDTTVMGIGSVVVAELRAAGYMESTIGQYEKSIKALVCFADEYGGVYTPALGAAFASMTISPRTGRFSAQRSFDYSRLVGVFDAYVLRSLAEETKLPCAMGFPIGHGDTNVAVPLGVSVRLDATRGTLEFLEPATATGTA